MVGSRRRVLRQLLWFAALWIAGVAGLGAMGSVVRLILGT